MFTHISILHPSDIFQDISFHALYLQPLLHIRVFIFTCITYLAAYFVTGLDSDPIEEFKYISMRVLLEDYFLKSKRKIGLLQSNLYFIFLG